MMEKDLPVSAHNGADRPTKARGALLHTTIARDLGTAILAGHYQPGNVLFTEMELSERLGVSRGVCREALRILISKGLVESRPKFGTRVGRSENWQLLDPDVLAWMFASEPSRQFVLDLFELRLVVEPAAAAFAAQRRTGNELARMGHALGEMAAHGLADARGQAADELFHRLILDASRNAALRSLASTITSAVRWTTIFKQRKRGLLRDPIPAHQALYEAIANAAPDAARKAMVELIERGLEDTEAELPR